ncbi:MAG TPA: hypothetical protein VGY91_11855 [Chthoniobacterales bacterium]|jgi:hypothetical protein|nr:hypothetical protein [Chthoniobacterales bacterium]
MEESIGIAAVFSVEKHPVVEVAQGVQTGGYTIRAGMQAPARKYSDRLYLVKILEPKDLEYLESRHEWEMEHGVFSFGSVRELKVGTKLRIAIYPAPRS